MRGVNAGKRYGVIVQEDGSTYTGRPSRRSALGKFNGRYMQGVEEDEEEHQVNGNGRVYEHEYNVQRDKENKANYHQRVFIVQPNMRAGGRI